VCIPWAMLISVFYLNVILIYDAPIVLKVLIELGVTSPWVFSVVLLVLGSTGG
jgi:hypothetical protein